VGAASKIAAQGFLGKVYMYRGNFSELQNKNTWTVVSWCLPLAGVSLESDFAQTFSLGLNQKSFFATQLSNFSSKRIWISHPRL